MPLLLLGWNNIHNQSRIKEVEQQLKSFFDETYIHIYQHRIAGEGDMDVEKEVDIVSVKIKDQKDLVIFAKSLGTVLSMKLMIDKWIVPQVCIFVWLPLWYIRNMWFPLKTYLSKISCPVLFIQNKEDPAGSYTEVVREIGQISNNFSFVELPGSDHNYSDVEKFSEVISNYLI